MRSLNHIDFEIAACQATLFTPDEEFSSVKIIQNFYPGWGDLFDADPIILPPFPSGIPGDVARIVLQSTSETWRCEIAPARINFLWRRTAQAISSIELGTFFAKAFDVLIGYQQLLGSRIGRLATVITRFALHDTPALFLARHFCQDRWSKAPLNRPENFELHAHKQFLLDTTFQVNSWARSKTGHLTKEDSQIPIVMFEQDLNTILEEAPTKSFSAADLQHFLHAAASELDVILRLYYPQEREK